MWNCSLDFGYDKIEGNTHRRPKGDSDYQVRPLRVAV